MAYSSAENITAAIADINLKLETAGFDSRVLVMDFTHITEVQHADDLYDMKFLVVSDDENKYFNILEKEAATSNGYAKFDTSYAKLVRKLSTDPLAYLSSYRAFIQTEKPNERILNIFEPEAWHQTLINEGFGAVSLILAKRHSEARSAMYLILSGQMELPDKEVNFSDVEQTAGLLPDVRKVINEIFIRLEQLLLDEMLHHLFQSYRTVQTYNIALIDFERMVLAHTHNFFQLDVESPMQTALDFLQDKKYALAEQYLIKAVSQYKVMYLINCSVFGKTGYFAKIGIRTLQDMIRFLQMNFSNEDILTNVHFQASGAVNYSPQESQLIEYFTLLFNLWQNASKSYDGKNKHFSLTMMSENSGLIIQFVNESEMGSDFVTFLKTPAVLYPSNGDGDVKYKGLQIVKDLALKLKLGLTAEAAQGITTISLTVNPIS